MTVLNVLAFIFPLAGLAIMATAMHWLERPLKESE